MKKQLITKRGTPRQISAYGCQPQLKRTKSWKRLSKLFSAIARCTTHLHGSLL